MSCGILELIGTEKRRQDIAYNIEGTGRPLNNEGLTMPTIRPIEQSEPLTSVADRRLQDIKNFNLFLPPNEQFYRHSLVGIDRGIIDTPDIETFVDVYYQNILAFNKYRPLSAGECVDTSVFSAPSEFYENYEQYIVPIKNYVDSGAYNAFNIVTGNNNENDSQLGLVGAQKYREDFQINVEAQFLKGTVGRLNTDVFSLIEGDRLIRQDFQITVPRTPIGRTVNYLRRLQGLSLPFSYIPPEAFDMEEKLGLSSHERNSLLLSYTGRGQREAFRGMITRPQRIYRPYVNSKDLTIQGNEYIAVELNGAKDTKEFSYKFINLDVNNVDEKGIVLQNGFDDGQYSIDYRKKGESLNNDLIGPAMSSNIEDESPSTSDWSNIGQNMFHPKSLLYKTKQIALEKNDLVFIDNFAKTFVFSDNGQLTEISKGDTTSAKNGFVADDGTVFQANDYFRVFNKGRKYTKLSRTLRHRGLDNGDTRSVLGPNGIPVYAPTKRRQSLSGGVEESTLKNYMFSISNSAWKGNAGDLPECEKYIAPNGDVYRTMWFAPYDMSISESTEQNITPYNFFGGPEPLYAASYTTRTATVSFALLKDHPSIVNTVKGIKTHIWERYFKGDKSVEQEVQDFAQNRLTPQEQEELNKLKRKFTPNEKFVDKDVLPDNESENLQAQQAIDEEKPFTIKPFSIYFPNESVELPDATGGDERRNAGYEDAAGTILGFTYLNGKQKTGVQQYRDDVNYTLNAQFYSPISKLTPIFESSEVQSAQRIEIIFVGHASAAISPRISNSELARTRAQNVRTWFENIFQQQAFSAYLPNNPTIEYKVKSVSDTLDTQTVDDERGDSFSAKNNRKVDILINVYETDEGAAEDEIQNINAAIDGDDNFVDNENTDQNVNDILNQLSDSIKEKIFKDNCEYFKYLELNEPMAQNTISEQIEYFRPAFHSYTPQNFNERLTFLQQCMRSANSISLGQNSSPNIYYGYQPFVYISIGDFFKTKAIIRSLSIDYNAYDLTWDLNPESNAGVEPMFAKVTISFDVIGGQSMSGAISRLQTALSYNFYANTEMYDSRSDTLIFDRGDDGRERAEILDGIKLSELSDSSTLDEANEQIRIRRQQGDVLPNQDRFNSLPPTEAPSEINDVKDLINLKKFLNLQLRDDEIFNLENEAALFDLQTANV